MSSHVILSLIFLVLSIGLLIYMTRLEPEDKKLKTFYIASTGVYVSGTLLIFILSLFIAAMTIQVVIAMELVVLFVYVFDTIILRKFSRSMNELQEAAIDAKKKEEDETQD